MTREPRFRAKKHNETKWLYGTLSGYKSEYFPMEYHIHWSTPWMVEKYHVEPIDPRTICEFTGVTDGNGKEIYEGDIIRTNRNLAGYGDTMVVVFTDGFFGATCPNHPQKPYWLLIELCRLFDANVIGNVYDNPELTKEHGFDNTRGLKQR